MATADLWQWGGPTIIVSSDGQEWTLVAQSQFPWLHSVIYGGGLFVAGGDSGAILTSTNGLDWTAQTSGNTSSLLAVAYNPQYYLSGGPPYLAVGADGVNLTSSDGTAWTVRTNFTSETLRAVAANNGELLVAGDNDAVFVGNGYNWTPVNVASWIGPSDPSSFPRSYRAAISIGNISVLGGRLYNS